MSTKKTSSKGLVISLIVLTVILIGGGFIARTAGLFGESEKGVEVTVEQVKLKTIVQKVASSGKIQPEVEVVIRPDVSGEVIDLPVKEGDFVRKNSLLLRIKPDIFQARIDELNAALLTQKSRLEQNRATLIQAEADFISREKLYKKDLISELEFIQSKSTYESQLANVKATQYQVESAEAQLRRAKEELEQTVIRAPQDGVVTGLAIEVGERVLGNSQTAGTEMMRISRLDRMEVLVDVNENDIVNVSIGDTARIEVDSYPERAFNGVVTEIANSSRVTGAGTAEQVTNYQVKVRIVTPHNLEHSNERLLARNESENLIVGFVPNFKPGMSATVDIETEIAVEVLSVPIQAVTVRNFAEDESDENKTSSSLVVKKEDIRKVVFIVKDGRAKRVEVETGISDNTHIQLMGGVEVGDEIVTGNYRVLSRTLKNNDGIKKAGQVENIASN